jgi:hypothetical protein
MAPTEMTRGNDSETRVDDECGIVGLDYAGSII